jgi:hypothetical protein
MADANDYSSWRQDTNGGIKYRFLGSAGNFTADEGEVTWRAIFRGQDLIPLLQELFPPPLILYGNIAIPQAGTMPGVPSFTARKISYKSLDGNDLPIDPFSQDGAAVDGTYGSLITVEVSFGPSNKPKGNPNDPRTFLEISSNEGGHFIYAPPTGTSNTTDTNSEGDDDQTQGGPVQSIRMKPKGTVVPGEAEPNRHPQVPSLVLVPTTEWSITWKQIPFEIFKHTIIWRMRLLSGRVNSDNLPWLLDAQPDTVLFNGFTYKESYTWRDGKVNAPPIDVTMKLSEKRVYWKGIVCGHQHDWYPGQGWRRVTLEDGSPKYRRFTFSDVFK